VNITLEFLVEIIVDNGVSFALRMFKRTLPVSYIEVQSTRVVPREIFSSLFGMQKVFFCCLSVDFYSYLTRYERPIAVDGRLEAEARIIPHFSS
jgi:hypothetical protein